MGFIENKIIELIFEESEKLKYELIIVKINIKCEINEKM